MNELRQTPLAEWHRRHGGRMVEFAGYEMPVRFDGVIEEHRRVRTSCGLFDVSHMGELFVQGPRARAATDRLVTNNVGALPAGHVLYTALCRENGTVIDDLLVYCLEETRFMIVCNAANHQRVASWVLENLPEGVSMEDRTAETALFALQGPKSRAVLQRWPRLAAVREAVEELDYYRACELDADGIPLLVSRTGYTGEWGYEIYDTEIARRVRRVFADALLLYPSWRIFRPLLKHGLRESSSNLRKPGDCVAARKAARR